jgi:outer membrane protein assembly factor BamB
MKKFISILSISLLVFAYLPHSVFSLKKTIPNGWVESKSQLNLLLSYRGKIYDTLTLKDPKTLELGYLFFDSENLPVLNLDTYYMLAQQVYLKEKSRQIKELVDFPISRETMIKLTNRFLYQQEILSPQQREKIKKPLRSFCLGGENLRRSAWQNYWKVRENLNGSIAKWDKSNKFLDCISEDQGILSIKQNLWETLLFGNLFLVLNDKSRETTIWENLYETLEPDLKKNPLLFCSQFSEILFQKMNNQITMKEINAVFSRALQSFAIFEEQMERESNPRLLGTVSERIMQAYTLINTPMFRINAKRTGKSLYQGPTTENLLWEKKLGGWIVSSPVVLEDQTVIIGCFDGNLYHLSSSGEILWKFFASSWIVSTPALSKSGDIYFGNQDGFLFSISSGGKLRWKINLGAMIGSSPVLTSSGDILCGSFDGTMVCVSPEGEIRWKFKTGSWILSSPAISDQGTILFGSTDHFIYCLSQDGSLIWKYKTGNMVVASPAINTKGQILIGSLDTNLYCFGADGSLAWKYSTDSWIISSPSIGENNQVFFAEKKGRILCLSELGALLWNFQTDGIIEGSPLLDKNDVLYITTWDRMLFAIEKGTLCWKFRFGSESRCTPALSKDGTLYIGAEDSKVYAFRNKPKKED